jgi:uncharacterized Rmd1/YagE family protein
LIISIQRLNTRSLRLNSFKYVLSFKRSRVSASKLYLVSYNRRLIQKLSSLALARYSKLETFWQSVSKIRKKRPSERGLRRLERRS